MTDQQSADQQSAPQMKVMLASASPRRKQLLEDAGVPVRVLIPKEPVDETLDEDDLVIPAEAAKKLAEKKAGAAVQELLAANEPGMYAVIGADTMVVKGQEIFGKPRNLEDAKRMLRALSGTTHQVITGTSLWMLMLGEGEEVSLAYRTFADTSSVKFKELTDEQIADYLKCGESFDKAGAYAIQGEGANLVESTQGALDTIIGLPVGRLLSEYPELAG
ncbi:MAG: septum formation protein Maf [Eggerthellaceae bacterium]|nr:septum formation protein Maf [Eggerthellaceae bacterium]